MTNNRGSTLHVATAAATVSAQRISRYLPGTLTSFGTTRQLIFAEYGLEVARVLLGHKHAAITEVYAEADVQKAVEVVGKIG